MAPNVAKTTFAMDVADPIDFPDHSKAPGLRGLDSSLRCPICGELFDGPVTLGCGHCFCSLVRTPTVSAPSLQAKFSWRIQCIRQTLNEKQSCPTCRKPDVNEGQLRVNSAMEEAVSAWKVARSYVLDLIAKADAQPPSEPPNKKRKLSSDPESSSPQLDDRVSCPSCGKRVKFDEINAHLDRSCKDLEPSVPPSKTKTQWESILGPKRQAGSKAKAKGKERASSEEDDPLPKKSYGVLKDKAIRELLQEHDLPTNGDRNALVARHQQWVILYNANLDKSEKLRKSLESLRRDLQHWEMQQKNKSKHEIRDTAEYQRHNQAEFARLVAAARPKQAEPAAANDAGGADRSSRGPDIIIVDGD
ncbi:E3 ubiquitin-protein ligase rad18 [Marasmius crinis-equi]|uniref:Postreplication repair E3 ubiquitin-protein ligase RAD18 n=1 Tax=Marasmius crinis-equi TaxID=585013 RepID=A0ABR3FPJ2_9AGAR